MQRSQSTARGDGISGHTESIVVTEGVSFYPLERRSDGLLMDRTCRARVLVSRRTDLGAERADMTASGLLHFFAVYYILQHR